MADAGGSEGWRRRAEPWMRSDATVPPLPANLQASLAHQGYLAATLRHFALSGSAAGAGALRRHSIALGRNATRAIAMPKLDWAAPQLKERTELWLLQQWAMVKDCAYETVFEKTRQCLPAVLPLLRGWAETNLSPAALRQQHLAWHDHTTPLRCINALYLLHMVAVAGGDINAAFPQLEAFFHAHLRLLMDPDFYVGGTNHGFDQAVALYLTAQVLDFGPLSAEASELGRKRLIAEIAAAFTEEGVHIENSPSYQPLMMARIVQASHMLGAFGDHNAELQIEETFNKGLDFLAYALRPDGTLPRLGDTDGAAVRLNFGETDIAENRQYFDYAITAGRVGNRPPFLFRVYPRAGYAFLRDRWGTAQDFTDTVQVAMKCGFLSTYHRHDDDNNVLLYASGEDWLVDGGLYKYHEQDPLRRYLRSCRAHNLLTIDGVEADRALPPPNRRGAFRAWRNHRSAFEITGRTPMYPGFLYDRTVVFDRQALSLTLEDSITATEPGAAPPAGFEMRFHLLADKTVTQLDPQTLLATSQRSGRRLHIALPPGRFDRVEVVSGRNGENPAGWASPSLGQIEPINSILLHAPAAPGFAAARLRFSLLPPA